ncbi:MAG TPA: uroporphyrinogen decarboxylase family protein, partial [Anaerolineaceae bacterium]|nr:uroporphyrinogen decarboxylase family protein [Anaerolineaceae bacterium]
ERVAQMKKREMQVLLHNCGNNRILMDQLIEAGIQCYQSIQSNAGMDIGELKAEFGSKLAFWGGMPVELLIMGTPEEVRKAVRKTLEIAAPGGGFIFGPSHSIAYGTKYENFMAMLEEFDSLRDKY